MAVGKLLNLLAISCLAIIASYGPAPVSAVSIDITHHHARSGLHAAVAKRQRAETSRRCKPRPTKAAETKAPAPAPAKSTPAPTKASPKPSPTSGSGSNSGSGGNTGNSGGGGGGKVGIAWPLGNDPAIKNFKTWKTNKYYTWSPWCVDQANSVGMECCPMLWGWKQVADFTKLVKPGYAKCVLGPNEPNQGDQSNMSPEDAANLWRQYIEPLHNQGYKLISPATTSAPSGKEWMKKFLAACNGCHVDAIAAHWYGTDSGEFIKYFEDFHSTFGKNLWITEFACQDFSGRNRQCSRDQVFSFMSTVTGWMDKTSYIEEYFAFGAMHDMYNVNTLNQLLGSNNLPTDLGRLYIGA